MLNAIAHGRLGRDAELRTTPEGHSVCELAIGCNVGRKGGPDGKRPTQWVRGSLWGKQAEALVGYLTKGKGVVVTLSDLQVREFKKQDGSTGTSLEGRVDGIEFTGAGPRDDSAQAPAPRPAPPPKPAPSGFADMDDDIPF